MTDKDIIIAPAEINAYLQLILTTVHSYQLEVVLVQWCYSLHKGLHFYIRVNPPIQAELAWLLQFLLGDDALRADFNRARIEGGVAHWNRLFERSNVKLHTIYANPRFPQEQKKQARKR
jgi:hypothetical protein